MRNGWDFPGIPLREEGSGNGRTVMRGLYTPGTRPLALRPPPPFVLPHSCATGARLLPQAPQPGFCLVGGGVQGGFLVRIPVDGAGSYSVAHGAGLLPAELTGMWGWILLRSPHQGRGPPPAPAPTKQRPAPSSFLHSHPTGPSIPVDHARSFRSLCSAGGEFGDCGGCDLGLGRSQSSQERAGGWIGGQRRCRVFGGTWNFQSRMPYGMV